MIWYVLKACGQCGFDKSDQFCQGTQIFMKNMIFANFVSLIIKMTLRANTKFQYKNDRLVFLFILKCKTFWLSERFGHGASCFENYKFYQNLSLPAKNHQFLKIDEIGICCVLYLKCQA